MLRYARCVVHTDLLRGIPVLLVASVAGGFFGNELSSEFVESPSTPPNPAGSSSTQTFAHVACCGTCGNSIESNTMLKKGPSAGFSPPAGSCQPAERANIPNLGWDWSGALGLRFWLRCGLAFEVRERETVAHTSVHPGLPKGPPASEPEPGGMQEGS